MNCYQIKILFANQPRILMLRKLSKLYPKFCLSFFFLIFKFVHVELQLSFVNLIMLNFFLAAEPLFIV